MIAKQDVDVAEAAYEGAKNLMQQRAALRDYTKVRAPYDGIITARFADPGALIQIATSSATERHSALHHYGSRDGPDLHQRAARRFTVDYFREDKGDCDVKEMTIARSAGPLHGQPWPSTPRPEASWSRSICPIQTTSFDQARSWRSRSVCARFRTLSRYRHKQS